LKTKPHSLFPIIFIGLILSLASSPILTNDAMAGFLPPGTEVDEFPTSIGEILIEGGPIPVPTLITLSGPATVHVFFDGVIGKVVEQTPPDTETVPTEIVQMELTGSSSLGPLTVRAGSDCPLCPQSVGEIEENENNTPGELDLPVEGVFPSLPGTADSFFDIFFEIDTPFGTLHNDEPMRISATLTEKPPEGTKYIKPDNTGDIPLLDGTGQDTGIRIKVASHTPIPIPTQVGGEFLSIEKTSLLLAGAQSFSWMIPLVLSVLGIGLFIVSRKSNE
jgi:hypothetical protein